MKRTHLFSLLGVILPLVAFGEVKTETVEYKQGETALEGVLAYDTAKKEKRPAVLVIHDWMGVSDHTRAISQDLAKMGYVAFAADVYGKGVRPPDQSAASAEAGKYKDDRALLRARAQAGLEQVQKHELVDTSRIAAIGFCFGGTTVLELARSGAEIAGVVSFHGGLGSPTPAEPKQLKAKILVLHGADDPFVKQEEIASFKEEMRKSGADWQMVYYGDAVHSFTQKKAGTDKSKGAAYQEAAAKRSWKAMQAFFDEIFASK
jgi:dienelactone hydrolase